MALFHDAARAGDVAVLRRVGKRDITRQDEDGLTPLHHAAKGGSMDAVRLLMGKGADPNALDARGQTCVHMAARCGHTAVVRHLVEVGSGNVWSLSDDNQTACDLAAERRHTPVFRYLESLQVRLLQHQRSATEKAKTRALRDFNKRSAAVAKQEAKATAKRKKLSTSSGSTDSQVGMATAGAPSAAAAAASAGLGNRVRSLSEPFESLSSSATAAAAAPSDSGKSSGKGKTGKLWKSRSNSASKDSISGSLDADPFPKVSGLREKFSLRPSAHSLATFVAGGGGGGNRDAGVMSVMTTKSTPAGRSNKMAQAVQRLQQLGGLSTGDEDALQRSLCSLPGDSDTDVQSTRSDSRGNKKKKQRSVSTSALDHGLSNPELFTPKGKQQQQQQQQQQQPAPRHKTSLGDLRAPAGREASRKSAATSLSDTADNDDGDSCEGDHSHLASFLHMLDLDSFLPLFEEEQMDIAALMLCSDLDLKDLDMPLGPRRKVLASLRQRKVAVTAPGQLSESHV